MYLTEKEAWYKRMMDESYERYGIVSIEYKIDNGNRADIYNTNGQRILAGLTLENAYWAVMGITNFYLKMFPER